MFVNANLTIFYTNVPPLSSGTRTIKQSDNYFDVNELHELLNCSSAYVVIRNDVSKDSEATERQDFIITDKLKNAENVDDTYVMSHFGKSLSSTTNRRIVLEFSGSGSEAQVKCTYSS